MYSLSLRTTSLSLSTNFTLQDNFPILIEIQNIFLIIALKYDLLFWIYFRWNLSSLGYLSLLVFVMEK